MSRVRMPPWPSRATVRGRRRLARQQPRQQQVGGGRLRVGAARGQAEDRRSAEPRQPEHRARVGRDAAPDDPAAQRLERDEERVGWVRRRAARGEDEVDGPSGPARRAPASAALDRPRRRRRRTRTRAIVEPSASTLSRTLCSNRSRARGAAATPSRPPPTRIGDERRDPDERPRAARATATPRVEDGVRARRAAPP